MKTIWLICENQAILPIDVKMFCSQILLMSDSTTMISSGLFKQEPTSLGIQRYITVASPTDDSDVELHHLLLDLPLVQVSGFGTKESETVGCHVFKNVRGNLLVFLPSKSIFFNIYLNVEER